MQILTSPRSLTKLYKHSQNCTILIYKEFRLPSVLDKTPTSTQYLLQSLTSQGPLPNSTNVLKILQFYNNIGLSFPNALVKSLIFFRICGLQKSCSLSSPLSLPNHSLTNTIFSEIWAPHGSCQNSTHISNYSNPLITNDLQWPQFNFANSIFLRVWAIQGPRRKSTNNLKIIQFYIYKQFRLQWSHSSHTYTTTSQSTWIRLLNLFPKFQ